MIGDWNQSGISPNQLNRVTAFILHKYCTRITRTCSRYGPLCAHSCVTILHQPPLCSQWGACTNLAPYQVVVCNSALAKINSGMVLLETALWYCTPCNYRLHRCTWLIVSIVQRSCATWPYHVHTFVTYAWQHRCWLGYHIDMEMQWHSLPYALVQYALVQRSSSRSGSGSSSKPHSNHYSQQITLKGDVHTNWLVLRQEGTARSVWVKITAQSLIRIGSRGQWQLLYGWTFVAAIVNRPWDKQSLIRVLVPAANRRPSTLSISSW